MKSDFDFEEEIRLIENLMYDNLSPRPPEEFNAEIANTIIESIPSSFIPIQDNDSQREEIKIVTNTDDVLPPVAIDKLECLNPNDKFDVSNDEDVNYYSFMFVIYLEMFPLLHSAESEDTIFNPGFTPHRLKFFLCSDSYPGPKDLHILSLRLV
nr:hypothetical protein [Tanacetum cinerariifolium]